MFTKQSCLTWNNMLTFINDNSVAIHNELSTLIAEGKTDGAQYGFEKGDKFIGVRYWVDYESASGWINFLLSLGAGAYTSSPSVSDILTTKSTFVWNNILDFIELNETALNNELSTLIAEGKTDGVQYGFDQGVNFIGIRHWIDETSANDWANFLLGLGASSYIDSYSVSDIYALTKQTEITWTNNILEFIELNEESLQTKLSNVISSKKTDGVQYGYENEEIFVGIRHWLDEPTANNWISYLYSLGANSYVSSAVVTDITNDNDYLTPLSNNSVFSLLG